MASNFSLPRHRHLRPYATVMLAGTLEESGYNGRIRARAGDVLIHPALDCHGNTLVSAGAKLIRLEWHDETGVGGYYHLDQIDLVARAAERSHEDAAHLLRTLLREKVIRSHHMTEDWPDMLASNLKDDPSIEIGWWAQRHGLAQATVSRGFQSAYGVSPAIYRAEVRARNAWLHITRRNDSLSAIAYQAGFSDQAHMTRWVHRITGAPPGAWREAYCAQPPYPAESPGTNRGF